MAAIQGDIPASALDELQALMDNLLNDISEFPKTFHLQFIIIQFKVHNPFY
jgi:hypothetical protein